MDPYDTLVRIGNVLLGLSPFVLWCAFWLWAVNWKKAWTVLAQGGWAPLVLLIVMVAFVWSRIVPGGYEFLPSFLWQLIAVLSWVGAAFFCGWLQGYFHITPIEIEVEPPAVAHGHDHGHH